MFQLEPKEVVEARKKDATRPCIYAADRGQSQSIYAYGIQDPQNQPPILRKPEWSHTMTAEQLDAVDQAAYAQWIAAMDSEQAERRAAGETDAVLNLYERNLEVWRQLWRVIERSSVLVLLADARCPLLHISDQLMDYLKTAFPSKRILLVLTKSDLVAPKRVQDWVTYLQQRYGQQIPVLAYSRENEDQSNAVLMRTIGELSATVKLGEGEEYDDDGTKTLTIGFVGEPNVGKSSLLNNLFGRKLVSVSATPGHTKHLQTHFFDRVEMLERPRCEIERVVVCDCPGVVFPRFNVPLSLQILFGSFPIAQTREPFSAIRFMAENCEPHLHEVYKLKPVEEDDGGKDNWLDPIDCSWGYCSNAVVVLRRLVAVLAVRVVRQAEKLLHQGRASRCASRREPVAAGYAQREESRAVVPAAPVTADECCTRDRNCERLTQWQCKEIKT